jgi:hypothetical protein
MLLRCMLHALCVSLPLIHTNRLSCRFVEALRAAVRHTSKSMGAYISSKMGGSGSSGGAAADSSEQQQQAGSAAVVRPFPYVVPIVAKSGNLLFDEAGRCTKVMRSKLVGVEILHTRSASSSCARAQAEGLLCDFGSAAVCSCKQLPAVGLGCATANPS